MIKTILRTNLYKMSPQVLSVNYSSSNPQNLPKLPVPKLNDTLNKLLNTVEPHLSPEKFENTKNVVAEFGRTGGIGEKLQQLLEKRAEKTENWLSDPKSNWWLNCAYLQYRDPVVVWSSPGLVFPQRKFKGVDDKIKFSARVVQCKFQISHL
jgi:carnitine O-acetyltransferase